MSTSNIRAGVALTGALALAAGTAAVAANPMVGGAAMYSTRNIVQNAVNSKDHTTLVAAVKAGGLVDTLSGKGPFTVFAPTNAAFAKLPAGTVDTLVKPENKDTLDKILTYHVVPGRITAQQIAAMAARHHGTATLKTVEGENLRLVKAGCGLGRHGRQGRQGADHDRQRHAVERRHPRRRHGAHALTAACVRLPCFRTPPGGRTRHARLHNPHRPSRRFPLSSSARPGNGLAHRSGKHDERPRAAIWRALLERGRRAAIAARLPALYDRTSAKLYGICLRLLGSEAEAEDALQDAYVTVWRNAARFDPAKASADHLAGRGRAQQGDRPAAAAHGAEPSGSTRRPTSPTIARPPSTSCSAPGRGAPVAAASTSSRRKPRAMIRAAFLDGASYPELAKREGVPLGTMKSWIRRGLLRLRGCLER